uniref:Uncharacterized protein n=1 Tax=Anguilla anguilla TaxID=7936 RepID=A0A0E9TRV7_ANGAN
MFNIPAEQCRSSVTTLSLMGQLNILGFSIVNRKWSENANFQKLVLGSCICILLHLVFKYKYHVHALLHFSGTETCENIMNKKLHLLYPELQLK